MNKNIYGWITPSKNIIYTGFQNHFEIINNEEFQIHFPSIKSAEDWKKYESRMQEDDYDDFVSQLDPDEHPGFHNLYQRTMVDELKNNWFYRFGTYVDSRDRVVLEIEGASSSDGSIWKDFVKKNFVVDRIRLGYCRGYKYIDM